MSTDLLTCRKVKLSNFHFPFLTLALDLRMPDVLIPATGIKTWRQIFNYHLYLRIVMCYNTHIHVHNVRMTQTMHI